MLKKQFNYVINEKLLNTQLEYISKLELQQQDISNYSINDLFQMNDNENIKFILCLNNENIMAYTIFAETLDFYEIYKIYVDINFRKLGVASHMINLLSDKDILLEVDSNNERAINFYKKNNFVQYSIRKKYYKNNNDAVLFKKKGEKCQHMQ